MISSRNTYTKNGVLALCLLVATAWADEPSRGEEQADAHNSTMQADIFKKEWKILKKKTNTLGFVRLNQEDAPQLVKNVRELASKSGVATPVVFVFAGNLAHDAQSYMTGTDFRINALALMISPDCAMVIIGDRLLKELPAGQLRAIIAHELGHIARNHAWKLFVWGLLIKECARAIAKNLLRKITRYDEFGSSVVANTVKAYGSRLCEKEADLSAARVLHDGKNVGEALCGLAATVQKYHPIWFKINQIIEPYLWWLSTHPTTATRVAYLNAEDVKLQENAQ